jgi:hypothetical protein
MASRGAAVFGMSTPAVGGQHVIWIIEIVCPNRSPFWQDFYKTFTQRRTICAGFFQGPD